MKFSNLILIALLGLFTFQSCDDDDDACTETTWYQDLDMDGLGNAAVSQEACTQPAGYVADNTDLDDDVVELPMNVARIADNIYSYVGESEYYSMFIVTSDGVIAIEPVSTSHSEGLLQAIQSVTSQPVKFMLHSHDHWDHSSGGQVFKDAGATTISHIDAFKAMQANTGPDMAVPDESWEGCQSDITLGGTTVEMHYLGINHGQGMTVFLIPDQKVAYIADLVTPNRVLFSIVPDFNIGEWERSLEEILQMDFDKAVFSHSESPDALNGGTKEDVTINLQIIRDIRGAIFAEFQNGTPGSMIPTTVQLPQYENFAGYDEWLHMNVWRIMLDLGMGPYALNNNIHACANRVEPTTPSPASGTVQWDIFEIAENIYSYVGANEYYSMFIVTTDGVIAIESVSTPHSEGLLEAIQSVTSQPVKFMLHSHDHWDHSSGGQVFKDAGATTIAHIEAFDAMHRNPGPDMAAPDESWEGCQSSITLGGTTVEMHYLGINHGLGMTVFVVPDQEVAYIADLVTPNRVLFSIVPDFNIPEWERSLEEILALNFEKAVYSHNESPNAIEGGDKQDVQFTLDFIQDIRSAIFAEFQNGTPGEMIPTTVQLPQYQNLAGYDEWLPMNVWRVMLDLFMGPYPWREVDCQ